MVEVKVYNRTAHTRSGWTWVNLPEQVGQFARIDGGAHVQTVHWGTTPKKEKNKQYQAVCVPVTSLAGSGEQIWDIVAGNQAEPDFIEHANMSIAAFKAKTLNVSYRGAGSSITQVKNLIAELQEIPNRSGGSVKTYRGGLWFDKLVWVELTVELFSVVAYAKFILHWGIGSKHRIERKQPRFDMSCSSPDLLFDTHYGKPAVLMDTGSRISFLDNGGNPVRYDGEISDSQSNMVSGVFLFPTSNPLELSSQLAETESPLEAMADWRGYRYGIWPQPMRTIGASPEADFEADIAAWRSQEMPTKTVFNNRWPTALAKAWSVGFHLAAPDIFQGGPQGGQGAQLFGRDARLWNPKQLDFIRQQVYQEVCRGGNHRDPDSPTPVMLSDSKRPPEREQPTTTHPTSYHGIGFPAWDANDVMGKSNREKFWQFFLRWFGSESQHDSWNAMSEFLMMTFDVGAERIVEQWVEAYLFSKPNDSRGGFFNALQAPRGMGRPFQWAAWLWILTGDDRILERVDYRVKQELAVPVIRHTGLADIGRGNESVFQCWQGHVAAMGLFAIYETMCREDALKRGMEAVELMAPFWKEIAPGVWRLPYYISVAEPTYNLAGQYNTSAGSETAQAAVSYALGRPELSASARTILQQVEAAWIGTRYEHGNNKFLTR